MGFLFTDQWKSLLLTRFPLSKVNFRLSIHTNRSWEYCSFFESRRMLPRLHVTLYLEILFLKFSAQKKGIRENEWEVWSIVETLRKFAILSLRDEQDKKDFDWFSFTKNICREVAKLCMRNLSSSRQNIFRS